MKRALKWDCRRTGQEQRGTVWVIEGAAFYGAHLAGTVAAAGFDVAEASRMGARTRHGIGKSDPLDAARIARGPRNLRRPDAPPYARYSPPGTL